MVHFYKENLDFIIGTGLLVNIIKPLQKLQPHARQTFQFKRSQFLFLFFYKNI